MASLYIKDADTAELPPDVAELLGTSKTAAVHDALLHRKRELEQARPAPAVPLRERIEAWRKAHPLGRPTGLVADKAFYDSLNDEDDD